MHPEPTSNAIFDGILEFTLSAQLQSFTAAALRLGLTSSAVGKSVSRLESRLGVKLLHRTTRKLTLTNEGEVYLASCLRATEDLRSMESLLTTGSAEPKGRLRIDLPAAFGRRHIAPFLIDLSQKYTSLDLVISFSEQKIDMVNEGVDLAVRIGELKDEQELVARRIGTQSLVVCATPDYLTENAPIEDPGDLLVHHCIIAWKKGTQAFWLFRDSKGQISRQAVRARHELADGEMMLHATLRGCGVCQLPRWLVDEHLESGRLVTVLDKYAGAEMPISVIWTKTKYIQPKVRMIVDALIDLARRHNHIFCFGD